MSAPLVLALAAAAVMAPCRAADAGDPFVGRWDLTIQAPGDSYPSWLEVTDDGSSPLVRIVGRVASVHPAKDVKRSGSQLSFDTEEWFGKTISVTWEMRANGRKVTGTQSRGDGVKGTIAGEPAPPLDRAMPASWSASEPLFNGKDLSGWEPMVTGEPGKSAANRWKAINGELVNEAAGANIRTTRKFQDFKLHLEYNCPDEGNSGVYLRGRYETQVEYEAADRNDKLHGMGAIYGFLGPATDLPRKPGQWESFDVTLVGRKVTVVRDDVKIIDNQEIPGITGGALNSREAEPGPLYIQGDHTGGMKYRNITISVPRK